MITLTEDQAQQIEEALDELRYANNTDIAKTKYYKALSTIRTARAQADHIADADKMVREPVAVVDANDDGYWADILPDRSVKVGQKLYAAPIEPVKQEPVAMVVSEHTHSEYASIKYLVDRRLPCKTKLYAAPVSTKDLTDEEERKIITATVEGVTTAELAMFKAVFRAAIAADRRKNK